MNPETAPWSVLSSLYYCNIHEDNPPITEELGNPHGLRTVDMHTLNDFTLPVKYFTPCTDKLQSKTRLEMAGNIYQTGKGRYSTVMLKLKHNWDLEFTKKPAPHPCGYQISIHMSG